MESESEALQTAKQKRKAIVARSEKASQVCASLERDVDKLISAVKDSRLYRRKIKKKAAAASVQIAELEGEIAVLERPPTDPVWVESMRRVLQSLREKNAQMRVELAGLDREESELKQKTYLYGVQNGQLRAYLQNFPRIRHYYLTHKPVSVRPKSPSRAAPGAARLVLECNKIDIQAT
jgi:hypothetical protein